MRTGAASGVATRALARADARTVGLFGSGWQASSQLEAICRVRPIHQAWVYSRNPERRERFARERRERLGIDVTAVDEPRRAVAEADIVATITTASEPLFDGRWLRPGTHLNVAGANRPRSQEVDVETVRRAQRVAIDDKAQGQLEAGDLLVPIAAGVLSWDDVCELGDVVAGKIPGRADDGDITLFKSLGVALEDIAVARVVVDKARAAGLGEALPETILG
jgi:ornithine cyclodeaminase/alanine dehydrogenase